MPSVKINQNKLEEILLENVINNENNPDNGYHYLDY